MSLGRKRAATAALCVVALASCAVALGAPRQVEKLELPRGLGRPERLVAYGGSRLLLLRELESRSEIFRLNGNGSLDRSFGEDGRIEMSFSDVVVAPDGKILVAHPGPSPADPADSDAQVTRLLADGGVDRSFGNGGTADVDLGGRYDGVAALTLAADGKIVLGGTKQTRPSERGGSNAVPALARLRPNGAVDRSFAKDGVRILPGGWEGGVFDVARAPHGEIVAEGEGYLGTEVWRLRASGALDRRFGKRGSVNLQGRGRRSSEGWEEDMDVLPTVGVLDDGDVVLAGTGSRYDNSGSHYRVLALRLRADGRIDRSYGRRGWAAAAFSGSTFAEAAAFLPDGELVVAADAQSPQGKRSDVGALAFRLNGKLDRRFGKRGRLRVDLDGWDMVDDAVVGQGGRVVILAEPGKWRGSRWLVRAPLSRLSGR
jgi:uncharacterized delta-60 repeat protein